MKIQYEDKKFRAASLELIDHSNDVIADFADDDLTPTLRQLYYQLVSQNLIENSMKSYNNLGNLIRNARYAGLISWTAIEDKHRTHNSVYIQGDLNDVLDGIQHLYTPDLWEGQENYVEVWVEKDALTNIVERPARRWDVPYMACKGYMSATEMWKASQRFQDENNAGKYCHLIHLGDHDPSGIDMTRDNGDRLSTFGEDVEVHRIALTHNQVEEYAPPPNPAKLTDSRVGGYLELYGESSWELDALRPKVLDKLIDDKIRELVDVDMYDEASRKSEQEKEGLRWISDNTQQVLDYAQDNIDFE